MIQQLKQAVTGDDIRAYSIEQFAARYGVGRTRVFEEIAAGRLLSYNVGRRRYISIGAAENWQRNLELQAIKRELNGGRR